jgi:hypothetical protein
MAEKNKKLLDDYKINNKVFDMIEAEADKTNINISLYDDKKTSGTEGIHTTLAVAGLVPGIGNVADILDAALYGLEGDKLGVGLSLISAIPALGLITGSLKIGKQGAKAAKIAKTQKQQTQIIEQTQDVIKRYGGDPTDTKLVTETTDTLMEAAEGLVKSGQEMDKLVEAGMDFEDALSYITYKGSLEPRAIKAAKDLKKMGYTDESIYGKEAVDEMKQIMKRGKELYKDPIYSKILKGK